jgi:acyl carrier protein
MEVENKLRELLLPVFSLDTIDEIKPEHSLVKDLNADSIDFVEILYLVEQNFKVVLKTDEIVLGDSSLKAEDLFNEGVLTKEGATKMNSGLTESKGRFKAGMKKRDLFEMLTVKDLANIISTKQAK